MDEILVNTATSQLPPAITSNVGRDFVVIWNDVGEKRGRTMNSSMRFRMTTVVALILSSLFISTSLAQVAPKRPLVIPPDLLLKDFDVVSTSADPNGFALNPKWGRQVRDGTLPSPLESCPMASTDPGEYLSPRWPNCTSYPVFINPWNLWVLGVCHHVNFMPVTYEGTVTWNGTGRIVFDQEIWPLGDYDWTFNLSRKDDQALYVPIYPYVHIEFDVRETVHLWNFGMRTWWERFHRNGVDRGHDQARQMIDGRFAVVTGLLGLDAAHNGGKPELHPVYAMFVRVNERLQLSEKRPVREASWAFFVKNWGNEGFCGTWQMDLNQRVIKVQLPHPAETMDYAIWNGARNASDLSSMGVTAQRNPDGTLLTFTLLPAAKQSWFMGDLIFRGPQPIAARVSEERIAPQGLQPRTTNEPEEVIPRQLEPLRAQIEKLPASSRKELHAQQERAVLRRKGMRQAARVAIAKPTRVRATHTGPARVVGHRNLVRPRKDDEAELEQQKKLQVLIKFFADRGVQLDLPPKK